MREGYGVILCMCICVSVTTLTATYLVCDSKIWFYKVPYGVPNVCILYISLKMLCSPALASFADAKLLDFRHSTFYLYVKSCMSGQWHTQGGAQSAGAPPSALAQQPVQ